MPVQFTCERCEVTFTRPRSTFQKYCSQACYRSPRPIEIVGDGTARVPLFGGAHAIVDVADLPLVEGRNWSLSTAGYAKSPRKRTDPPGLRRIFMHRWLLGLHDGEGEVDHADGNTLNNCRSNLRRCNRSQNTANTAQRKIGVSGYRGVTWHAATKKWRAKMRVRGRDVHIGLFASPEEAAIARDRVAREAFGEFAVLNFP